MASFIGDILTRHGSDKDMPGHHSYGAFYDTLFPSAQARHSVRNVLEVGIAEGQSCRGWLEAFPYAHVVGVDIQPCSYSHERFEFHQGDQRDELCLLRAVGGRQFDLIVEDASHFLDNSLRTLFFLWPHLALSGCYVIEELEDINGHLPHLQLFRGVQVFATQGPTSVEHLVMIRR